MPFAIIAVKLAGATLLLLFAVHLVRQGMENAYGSLLRRKLGANARGRVVPAMTGTFLAILLQSSTAVAMLAAGLGGSGILSLPTGLSVLLGADLGSAVVVRVLSFDPSWLLPLLLLTGGFLHLKTSGYRSREAGRILLGIAFVLLSLRLIGEATAPLRESSLLPSVVNYLASDHFTALIVAALFTWAIHSSVAALILILSFANHGLLPLEAGYPLILGANLGSGLIAFWLSRGLSPESRRIPLGNLVFRAAGVLAMLLAGTLLMPELARIGGDDAGRLANLHLLFNAVLAVACLPFATLLSRLLVIAVPSAPPEARPEDPYSSRFTALDPALQAKPGQALAAATREVLFMGDVLKHMFEPVMELLRKPSAEAIGRVRHLESHVNRTQSAVKLYVASINRRALTSEEARRSIELIDAAINLEHAGDIVSKSLMELAEERLRGEAGCSQEGWAELQEIHEVVLRNMALAYNLLIYPDAQLARALVRGKEEVRRLVRQSHERHLSRLRENRRDSIDSSNLHVEAARAFKEINALFATLAYPMLTERGDLAESRLSVIARS